MKRIIALVLLVPLAILVVAFAVANRHPVLLSLDPFNADAPSVAIAVPLYILLFATLFVGILAGGIGTWVRQGRWRKQARGLKREAKVIRRENEAFKQGASTSPATLLPVTRRDAA